MKKIIDNKKAMIFVIISAVLIDVIAMAIQNNLGAFTYEAMAFKAVLVFMSTYYFLKMLTNNNREIIVPATITVSTAEILLLKNNAIIFICAQIFILVLEKITQNKVVTNKKKDGKKTIDKEAGSAKILLFMVLVLLTVIMSIPAGAFFGTTISYSFNIAMLYFVLILSIWVLIKNRKNCKALFLLLGIASIIIVAALSVLFTLSNENISIEKTVRSNGLTEMFGFMYNFVGLFGKVEGYKWDTAYTIVSVFPVPIVIGMWYLYKNNKHEEFIFPMVVGMTLTSIIAMMGKNIPDIIQIITLSKWMNTTEMVFVTGLLGLYLMFYLMSNTDEKLFSITAAIRLTMAVLVVSALIPFPYQIGTRGLRTLYCIPYTVLSFLMIQYNVSKKYQRWCARALATVSIIEFFIYIGFFIGQ